MTNTDTVKQLYGLLGRNISYSLSPAMHNAAFKHFGINAEYRIFDVEPENVESFFNEYVVGGKVFGMNVTVPYKVIVKELLEKCTRSSVSVAPFPRLAGAVNTLAVQSSNVAAFNTDGEGFYVSLKEDAGFDPKGKDVFVLGAGGAGRVIALYLASLGEAAPNKINVYDVDTGQIGSLRETVELYRGKSVISCEVGTAKTTDDIAEYDLIVNATPLGTKEGDKLPVPPDKLALLTGKTVIYDLVYARETELVKFARQRGLRVSSGEGMLANQGALAFEKWTGKPLDEIKLVMRKALMEALKRS